MEMDKYTDDREIRRAFDYFQNPADTVYTLLLAYPQLSSSTQQQVKAYLQTTMVPAQRMISPRSYILGGELVLPGKSLIFQPKFQADGGQPYTSPYNPSTQPICGWCGYWQNFPPFSFYAAWKYALQL